MAMAETILATISGLGGAGLGAAGALLVQRAKHRDDATAAAVAADRADDALTLEIIATARVAARAWLTISQHVIADLQNGRAVDAQRYDDQLQAEYKEFTSALYRLGGRLPTTRQSSGPVSGPLADQLSESTQRIRDALYGSTGTAVLHAELAELRSQVSTAYSAVNTFLVRGTEAVIDREIDSGLDGE
ncbi:hypothetical protein [Streptomyces sp. NPDC091371]|uniref:hypothetical protein n=1 Tax=Streptomyces sp. NPDC091371 TaxID=3155303 RepID=UPI00342EED3C